MSDSGDFGLAIALRCQSNYSFLRAASYPDELCSRAAELGYQSLAITDRHSLSGMVRAHQAAKEAGIHLIVGAEIAPIDSPVCLLWAPDRAAYAQLCQLLTQGSLRATKGEFHLEFPKFLEQTDKLFAGISLPPVGDESSLSLLHQFREAWGDRGSLCVSLHEGPDDRAVETWAQTVSHHTNIPLLAAGDVRYHTQARWPLYEVLTATRLGVTVDALAAHRLPSTHWSLPDLVQRKRRWHRLPAALERAAQLAACCRFSLDELCYEYPQELSPQGMTPLQYLQKLTWEGAHERYPHGVPDKVNRLLEHELALISTLHYEAYFLTVWDLIRFARSRNILCQGRGSAANSAVCYCLGITAVDPDCMDVLFERFMSQERNEAPDIDVDFEHERREEVLQYLYQKYGRERAGMTGVVTTYQLRSAIRDVGKALGLSWDRVDRLAKQVEGYSEDAQLSQRFHDAGIDPESRLGKQLVHLVRELIGFPRHLSQHVGGMVITRGRLCEMVPIENAAMPERTVIQWNKDDLDALGILKVDCLSLGMLTAIHKCFDLIERHENTTWHLATIPPADPNVYDSICRADTMGVFQIESRAQMSMLPRLLPRCYYDLVIEVAIVRPGPIQGQMVHPYLRRRAGEESVTYPNDAIREVLKKTLGVPIFQEQAMRLAVVAAGFTPGEADQLRRAMGAWRRPGLIDDFRQKLIAGMQTRGLSKQFAEQVFQQIRGFGEYGFPESHAASFALLVYASAWLKHYYPVTYLAALLNSQPMGFYAPSQLITDLRQRGCEVRPIDVNHSDWDCTLEPAVDRNSDHRWALRLGFRLARGFSWQSLQPLFDARNNGRFTSVTDLAHRTQLARPILQRLAQADALTPLASDRRAALWEVLATGPETELTLWQQAPPVPEAPVSLPALSLSQQVLEDYRATGLSLKAHPIAFHRQQLDHWNVLCAAQLETAESDRVVQVAGIVLLRQRPSTAKGITFVTLEDETGTANLIIHQATWERFYSVAKRSPAWLARGKLESKQGVIHIIVFHLEDLTERLQLPTIPSRDFR